MNRARRANPNANAYTAGNDQGAINNSFTGNKQFQGGNALPGTPRPASVKAQSLGTPTTTPAKAPLKPILKKAEPKPAVIVPEIKPEEMEVQNTVVPAPVAQPSAPIPVDATPVESIDDSQSDKNESADMVDENGSSPRKPFFKKIFGGIRKKPSIRAKERKIRQNRHLRKVILPKNALMALYEVKGIQIGDFIINSNMEGGFTALVTVNDCQYEGVGNSKGNAKTNACEKALRDYVIKKMMQKPRTQSTSEAMDTGEAPESTNGDDSNLSGTEENDDVPMVNLASYALYKLFTAWENEGFHVPEFHPVQPQNNAQQNADTNAAKKPIGRNELPANWEIMHPATLLCIMRPRLTYTDCGNNGDATRPMQTVKVVVDDRQFVGTGRSKKVARKNVAIAVCNTLFNTNFQIPEEE